MTNNDTTKHADHKAGATKPIQRGTTRWYQAQIADLNGQIAERDALVGKLRQALTATEDSRNIAAVQLRHTQGEVRNLKHRISSLSDDALAAQEEIGVLEADLRRSEIYRRDTKAEVQNLEARIALLMRGSKPLLPEWALVVASLVVATSIALIAHRLGFEAGMGVVR